MDLEVGQKDCRSWSVVNAPGCEVAGEGATGSLRCVPSPAAIDDRDGGRGALLVDNEHGEDDASLGHVGPETVAAHPGRSAAGTAEARIEAAGCRMAFLPTYSPDLNPIGRAFAMIKQHLRRAEACSYPELFEEAGPAVAAVTPLRARAFFADCGFPSRPADATFFDERSRRRPQGAHYPIAASAVSICDTGNIS